MSKMHVHILKFNRIGAIGCGPQDHNAIIIEQETTEGKKHYIIDGSYEPADKATINDERCFRMLKKADDSITLEIEGNMDDIIEAWKIKYQDNKESNLSDYGLLANNCADTADWFLDTFLDIKNPGSCGQPITCNYTYCIPCVSPLQYFTVPSRVMDYVRAQQDNTYTYKGHTSNEQNQETSYLLQQHESTKENTENHITMTHKGLKDTIAMQEARKSYNQQKNSQSSLIESMISRPVSSAKIGAGSSLIIGGITAGIVQATTAVSSAVLAPSVCLCSGLVGLGIFAIANSTVRKEEEAIQKEAQQIRSKPGFYSMNNE